MVKDTCSITHKGKDLSPHNLGLGIPRLMTLAFEHLTQGTLAQNQLKCNKHIIYDLLNEKRM
jgi:hypothetical protein